MNVGTRSSDTILYCVFSLSLSFAEAVRCSTQIAYSQSYDLDFHRLTTEISRKPHVSPPRHIHFVNFSVQHKHGPLLITKIKIPRSYGVQGLSFNSVDAASMYCLHQLT